MGKKTVTAMKADEDPTSMHQYIWSKHIQGFKPLLKDKKKYKLVFKYFEMIDELVSIYDLKLDEGLMVWADV